VGTFVFDLEGDSLKPTKIWCIGVQNVRGDLVRTTVSYDKMRKLFSDSSHTFICHNGKRFDIPCMERLLGIKIKARLIDTLFTSWYLEPRRPKHGLNSYGEEAGIPKPPIEDWENLPIEEYLHRVIEDVKINMYVWKKHLAMLQQLYSHDMDAVNRLLDYLMLHADIAVEQEKHGWLLDKPRCERVLAKLIADEVDIHDKLRVAMPKVAQYAKRKPPANPFKLNGELSVSGANWKALTEENNLPFTYMGEIKVHVGDAPPNPGSVPQQKDWLFGLGWRPITFKYDRNKKTGDVKKIPQLRIKTDKGPVLCPSVKRLLVKEPKLALLQMLGVITHRISVLNGFMNNVDEHGYVQAQMQGLTNTLRWKHKVVLNLPGIDKPYGEDIRGCLIAPEGYELCGADQTALEDRTKQHFMFPHDPDYVHKMMEKGYCPHCDIAVLAGFMTEEEEDRHKTDKFFDDMDKKQIKAKRKRAKPVNYGGVYGQQPLGLSREADIPLKQAQSLFKIYWERNWSVKVIADEQRTKRCIGLTWLWNPISRMWYELRNKRDIFSTLNQGTGAYCNTLWIRNIMALGGPPVIGNMHDEVIVLIRKNQRARDLCGALLYKAIAMVNDELKLNRDLEIVPQFDDSYAGIH
jgi:hypothetical protein